MESPLVEVASPPVEEPPGEEPGDAHGDAWSCPICFMWFDMPVSPPCQHTFCAGCLKSVVRAAAHRQRRSGNTGPSGPACPLCREPFTPEVVQPSARIFEEMLKATVTCRNGDCAAQFCPLRWKKHQEECPSAVVQCMHHLVGCEWKGARRHLSLHVEGCAYEKIKGLIPRVSASLKQIHAKVHQLEARVMAQNAAVANTRALLAHQRRAGSVFPAVYALLWRPPNWRLHQSPTPGGGVLSNVTLICLAPILFLALCGAGVFGGGGGLVVEERAVCLVGVAILGFVALLEHDNESPYHELQTPSLLKGLAIGEFLLEGTARSVVYFALKGLPDWKRTPALLFLLAPLFYPTVVQAVHRFEVQVKNAHNQAPRARAQPPLPPVEPVAVKTHDTVVNGVVRGITMLLMNPVPALVGEVLAKLGVFVVSAALGPEKLDASLEHVWLVMSAGIALDDKARLKKRHDSIFRDLRTPLPNMTDRTKRRLIAAVCVCLFATIVTFFRDILQMVGYSRLLLSVLDSAHFRWELHIGRVVMGSLQQTRTNQDPNFARTHARDLLRSRLLLLWVVVGSSFFLLFMLTS
ncbi:unnamed protein product [Ectocarpus sp. 6 AP-2014]